MTLHLPSWDEFASLPDDRMPLLEGALLIAQDEYPKLDPDESAQSLARLARRAARRFPTSGALEERVMALSRFLFDECGFRGNQTDYYDPRNSYLNDVLQRRLGIPVSLALIQIEVARQLQLPLQGVSFPGHYLLRFPVEGGLLVLDPYQLGRSLDIDELRLRARPHFGSSELDDRQLFEILQPSDTRSTLMRMLRNLKAVYADRDDVERALRCSDRLLKLGPSVATEWRDRGLMYLQVGHAKAASTDLAHYLWLQPDAEDAAEIHAAQAGAEYSAGQRHLN